MRSIDQLKIDRIHKAAMDIVYQDGFDHISLQHIAKMAKVSPGAPYVYYKDKQDLLTGLCCICLEYVSDGLQDAIDSAGSLKEKIYAAVFNMVHRFCDVPLMVKYVIKFRGNPELYTEDMKKRYAVVNQPLEDLCREAIASGQAKTQDLMLMQMILLSTVIRLFDHCDGHADPFDSGAYAECVRLCVDAVMK